ncbi:MAG: hypothetical protein AAGF94_16965 [Pseudomonadota bacterium]
MKTLMTKIRTLAIGTALACFALSPSHAETFDSTIADTRTLAAFKVNDTALTQWLPESHISAPYGGGSFEGANLLMMFIDRMLHQDAEGAAKNGGAYRMMALIVPGLDRETGKKSTFIARVYSPSEGAGPYKTAVNSKISHRVSLEGSDVSPLSGRHVWLVEQDGGTLEIAFDYEAGVPVRKSGESVLSTPLDASVKRIYRYDQLTDVVLSRPKGIDRTTDVTVRVGIPELAGMFDGTELLIGLADRPFYTRTTWKP